MKSKKNASLGTIVRDAADALAEYARWPDTPARAEAADIELSYLREALHGYDRLVMHAVMVFALTMFLQHVDDLDAVTPAGLRLGLIKFADIIGGKK
jgi:hypothetical protein